jgi:hypothetical protein
MKKVFKFLGYTALVLVLIAIGLVTYVKTALPDVGPAPELKVVSTPERVERGKYLAHSVSVCMDCHSTRDWSKFAGPLVEGTLGKGGECFDQKFGFPGVYYSRNITPAGISRYTDGELYRVITTGVTKEGRPMFPVMPYMYYGRMDPEDIKCIIAYVRSLAPITNEVPVSKSDFPMNIIINTIPKKQQPASRPDPKDRLVYGDYLVNAAGCRECHTKENHGQIIPELAFGGGRAFKLPGIGTVRSANITPDTKTGIGTWTEQTFIARFRAYSDSSYRPHTVGKGEMQSVMPWMMYSKMTDADLGAIYTYLHSLKPQENTVEKFTASAN